MVLEWKPSFINHVIPLAWNPAISTACFVYQEMRKTFKKIFSETTGPIS
jgi:hypothetical protein